jgi:TonB family protein
VKELNARLAVALVAACALTSALAADAPADAPQPTAAVPFDVEVFKGVQILKGPSGNMYPMTEVMDGREGWVILDMMIDPRGKPYEVMVVDSSGNSAFERAALRAVDQVLFKPAERGGTPIDSSFIFKMKFAIADMANGASPGFASMYRRFIKAAQGGDRAAADKALESLKPQNLYEEAFANFAKFHFHRQWGTPAEQWADLERAIANEEKPTYLPKDTFAVALYSKFRLEVQASDYGRALDTWKVLEPFATPEMRKDLQPVVDRLRAAQAGDQRYRQPAVIPERQSWSSVLFRNRFNIVVEKGSISEIKLRCAQQYLFFKYEPGVQYSIGAKKDRCGIEVVGDPGTQFNLIQ